MPRESYKSMVADLNGQIEELFPWDLEEELASGQHPLLLDIRCPHEFAAAHIPGSLNVPRGILELAADYGYDETEPELVQARERQVVIICRSGNRSMLAAQTLRLMGFTKPVSLKTGLKGWNDYEQPLIDQQQLPLDFDTAERLFAPKVRPEQLGPVTTATN